MLEGAGAKGQLGKRPRTEDGGVSVCSSCLEVWGIAEIPASSHLLLGQREGKEQARARSVLCTHPHASSP